MVHFHNDLIKQLQNIIVDLFTRNTKIPEKVVYMKYSDL